MAVILVEVRRIWDSSIALQSQAFGCYLSYRSFRELISFLGSEVSVEECVSVERQENSNMEWKWPRCVSELCMCDFPEQFSKKYFKPSHTPAVSIDQRWAARNGSDKQPNVQMLKESLFKPLESAKLW